MSKGTMSFISRAKYTYGNIQIPSHDKHFVHQKYDVRWEEIQA